MFLQPVDVFTIHIVLQNCSTGKLQPKEKSFRRRLLMENRSHVPSINAASASRVKIRWILTCNLLSADVVQRHTTENACQSTAKLFPWFPFLDYESNREIFLSGF